MPGRVSRSRNRRRAPLAEHVHARLDHGLGGWRLGDGLGHLLAVHHEAVDDHLEHRGQRNGEEDSRDPVERPEREHGEEAQERAHADLPAHDARDEHVVLELLDQDRPGRHQEHRRRAHGHGGQDRGHGGEHGAHQRHRFEQRRERGQRQHVGQPDRPVAHARGHAHRHHGDHLPADEGAELRLDLVPHGQRLGPARHRQQGDDEPLDARQLERPVEAGDEDGDQIGEGGHEPRGELDEAPGEPRRHAGEPVDEPVEGRHTLPDGAHERHLASAERGERLRVPLRDRAREAPELLDRDRADEDPHDGDGREEERVDQEHGDATGHAARHQPRMRRLQRRRHDDAEEEDDHDVEQEPEQGRGDADRHRHRGGDPGEIELAPLGGRFGHAPRQLPDCLRGRAGLPIVRGRGSASAPDPSLDSKSRSTQVVNTVSAAAVSASR